ncbi:MAG TPA: hypothetical protein VGB98_26515 [Pyrinomonadaceae bacterium]|jgi:hypothetical protein
MTSLRQTFSAVLSAALLAAAQAARAQGARPESKRLSVEVVEGPQGGGRGRRFEVPERVSPDGYAEFGLPRRATVGVPPKGRPPLTHIRLRASYEGDAVRLRTAAVFDDSYPAEAPGPKYGAREQELDSRLAHEGETVTVEGLKRFGFEPLVLKVVRAEPAPEPPPTPAPTRALSRLKAVEVISFAAAGARLERGLLTLLNVSQKNVSAVEVNVPDYGISQTALAASGRALMQPGGTFQTEITLGSSGRETPEGFVPDPPPATLVVGTVIFDDGSYEGDVKVAARMAARQKGRLSQFARVLRLLLSAADARGGDAPAALDALKSRVAELRIDAEPPLLDGLLAQFPELSGDVGRKLVAEAALDGLRAGREESLNLIRKLDASADADPRRQLESVREQIEKRVGVRRD